VGLNKQTNPSFKAQRHIPQLLDRQHFYFFGVLDILRRILFMSFWCLLRLAVLCRLPLKTTTCEQRLFWSFRTVSAPTPLWSCPDQLAELGGCRLPWIQIKYWCLAFCAACLNTEELRWTAIAQSSRENGGFKESRDLSALSCQEHFLHMHLKGNFICLLNHIQISVLFFSFTFYKFVISSI